VGVGVKASIHRRPRNEKRGRVMAGPHRSQPLTGDRLLKAAAPLFLSLGKASVQLGTA
jgi:hypothetical protein